MLKDFQQFLDEDPDADDFQHLISSSLSDQSFLREVLSRLTERQTDRQTNDG